MTRELTWFRGSRCSLIARERANVDFPRVPTHLRARRAAMESPAAALRRHQTEVRRLLRGGFTKCALLRTAHAAWREEGKGAPQPRRAPPTLVGIPRPHARATTDAPSPPARHLADILTELANAALLRDQGPSHPLPEHLSALPDVRDVSPPSSANPRRASPRGCLH